MGKVKVQREVTDRDINCLENLVVAYNTVFLMSSIFIVSIASTAQDLFSDFFRVLSPSVLLLIVGGFTVFIAAIGYVGVAKKSGTLISLYTLLIIFVFVMELSAGLGILSFRREIKSMVSFKMRNAMNAYADDPMTANLVDYAQLELSCCGVQSYRDWDGIFNGTFQSNCRIADLFLPQSCCKTFNDTPRPLVNMNGCLPALNSMLHRSALLLTTAVIAICTVQILGAHFSYTLASSLKKFKIQRAINNYERPAQQEVSIPPDYKEKVNYF